MLRTIYYALGIAVLAILLFQIVLRGLNRPVTQAPCDTCKHLLRKTKGGMSEYKYSCDGSGFERGFDRPPEYCSNWKPREDGGYNA